MLDDAYVSQNGSINTNAVRVAGIVNDSIVDGPGIRLAVFAQGCSHNCPGCHNPHTHPFDAGKNVSIDEIMQMINKNPLLDGVTLTGGEPFEQASSFAVLARMVKDKGLNVVTYTGYTWEQIIENMQKREGWHELLANTDILVDGPFDISRKSLNLRYRGSSNQRVIDVKKSLEKGKIILWCE